MLNNFMLNLLKKNNNNLLGKIRTYKINFKKNNLKTDNLKFDNFKQKLLCYLKYGGNIGFIGGSIIGVFYTYEEISCDNISKGYVVLNLMRLVGLSIFNCIRFGSVGYTIGFFWPITLPGVLIYI